MSATGRTKNIREPNDYYPTPSWCVDRFLERVSGRLPSGTWLEPCAGNGAIISVVKKHPKYLNNKWVAIELQDRFEQDLKNLTEEVRLGNFLFEKLPQKADVCITNPPYVLALPIIQHAISNAKVVCMLLRLNFLASDKRQKWMSQNLPDVYVLPNRPSFKGKGTDACEYAWFVWDDKSTGKIEILDKTTRASRLDEKRKALSQISNYLKE